jgi:ABC-type nitrate/sulfonate/bicarbonate transport system substrate-binding protein
VIGREVAAGTLVLVGLALAAGCARPPNELLDRPGGRIRVAYTSTPDLNDVPSLMAHHALEARGYSVETVFYAQPELATQALSRGDADVALGSARTFWASAYRGAPIVAVMEAARNDHLLVTASSLHACADLEGRRVGSHSAGSVGHALLEAYLSEQCAGTEPLFVHIPGSSSRMSGLLSGLIDAAVLQHDDLLRATASEAERLQVLEVFGRRWPNVATTLVFVNTHFARAHPRAVEDYLRACLEVNRDNARDPAPLAAEAARVFETTNDLLPVVKAYVAAGAWDTRGGLTDAAVEETRRFFIRTGSLPGEPPPGALVDRSYLDRVLDELARADGRR